MNEMPTPIVYETQKDIDAIRFGGDVDLRDAVFKCFADFSGKRFKGKVDFTGAVFEDGASFEDAQFLTHGQDVLFDDAVFLPSKNNVIFQKTQFGLPYQREFGDWEIWFVKRQDCFFIRRGEKRAKDETPPGETETLGKFQDSSSLILLLVSKGMGKNLSIEIAKSFEKFKGNPKNVSFYGCRFGDMDIIGFSDEEIQTVIENETKRTNNLTNFGLADGERAKLEGFKKFFAEKEALRKDPDRKLKSSLILLLSRHLKRETLESKRTRNPKFTVRFSGVEFNNDMVVNFYSSGFINSGIVLFESSSFNNGGAVNFLSACFSNGQDVIFNSARFNNRGDVNFLSASFSNRDSVWFETTSFSNGGDVSFDSSRFTNGQNVNFRSAKFSNGKDVYFDSLSFTNARDVFFTLSKFTNGGVVWFDSTSFCNGQNVYFQHTKFANGEDVFFRFLSFSNGGAVNFFISEFQQQRVSKFCSDDLGKFRGAYLE